MDEKRKREDAFLPDEKIIELYFFRDEAAISKTDEKYGKNVHRIAYNILHDRLDSEECKNDTYLSVWNTIPPTRPKVFPAYLSRIIRNIAVNRYKERSAKKRVPSEFTVSLDEFYDVILSVGAEEDEYSAGELSELITAYVKTLPERCRFIFIGRYYMSETIEHIAKELSVGNATVHRELSKIKDGLRVYLLRNGVNV